MTAEYESYICINMFIKKIRIRYDEKCIIIDAVLDIVDPLRREKGELN